MAYVTASNRNTGDLITSGIWNQDAVDNPNFLKGLAGPVDIGDDLNPTDDAFSGTPQDLGIGGDPSTAKRWQDVQAVRLFGNRYQADLQRRTVRLTWENLKDIATGASSSDFFVDHHMERRNFAGGGFSSDNNVVPGGLGQIVLGVNNNQTEDIGLVQRDETLPPGSFVALDNSWSGGRFPYFKTEYSINGNQLASTLFFLGLRATPDALAPTTGEDSIGFVLGGNVFRFQVTDGAGTATSVTVPTGNNQRQTVEAALLSSSLADFYLNGAFVGTVTTNIPAGLMEVTFLLRTTAAGAAVFTNLTVGETVIQEDRV